jgi:flagellar basal body-associated protein FliL
MSNTNILLFKPKTEIIQKAIKTNAEKVLEGNTSKKAKTWIIVIVVIFVIAGIGSAISVFIDKKKKEAKLKWPDERCSNQLYMNYPGFFGPPGMTFAINKAFCEASAMNAVAKKNNAPLQNQLNMQNKTMGQFTNFIKKTNKMMYHYKKVVTDQVVKIRKDLADTFKRLAYTYKKFKGLFTDIFMVFYSTFNAVKYFIWTIIVWWKAPWGGGVLRFFSCFGEETLICLKKEGIKKICELKLGDELEDGNSITGLCKFKREGQVYKLGNLYVDGMHFVEYNGGMIRVLRHPDAIKVDYKRDIIYNILTNTGKIGLDGRTFSDYLGDNSLETYEELLKMNMESPIKGGEFFGVSLEKYKENALNLYPGFTHNSYIATDNKIKRADELEIGDRINGREIVGIINYKLEGRTFVTNYTTCNQISGQLVGIQIYAQNIDSPFVTYTTDAQEERWILGELFCIGIIIEGSVIDMHDFAIMDFDIVGDKWRAEQEVFKI